MTSFFSLASPVNIEVWFQNEEQRKHVDIKVEKDRRERYPVYLDGDSVIGKIVVKSANGKRLEHSGIKVSFIGSIESRVEKNRTVEFLHLSQELASPGEIQKQSTFDFEFKNVEKQYESFYGYNVRLRYCVSVVISRKLTDIVREREIWVYTYNKQPADLNKSIKMEVGIENCLHLEFEYNKSMYHLRDVIVGKIYFMLVRIKIQTMEISVIRRETTGSSPNIYNESENVIKYEIMDGAPQKGEIIPLRLFLGGFELGPTFQDVNKRFSVRYFLNLVLIDVENRRYFKQHEITLYRRKVDDGYGN